MIDRDERIRRLDLLCEIFLVEKGEIFKFKGDVHKYVITDEGFFYRTSDGWCNVRGVLNVFLRRCVHV